MNVDPADAERRIKEIGEPEYHIFDVLFYEGVDLRGYPQSMRKRRAHEIAERIFKRNDRVWVVADHADDKEKMYDQWVAEGGEGGILKDQDAPYGSGWVKVKRFATLDTIVTGYTDAEHGVTGKYVGLIGAVKVSVWKDGKLVEIGQVSGMTDADRIAFTKRKSAFLGSVMEIRAQELAKDRLRHPRFARMRPDMSKNSLTCTWKKMMEDLKAGAGR
jgi:ATP-dependent DNA ligase